MKTSLLFIFMLLTYYSFAQRSSITGMVIDQVSMKTLEYSSVALYKVGDSILIAGTITDKAGEFIFKNLEAGEYKLKIVFIGYDVRFVNEIVLIPDYEYKIGKVVLKPGNDLLDEITVTGNAVTAYNKIDKQVYKAAQFETARGGSAIDVLKNMPSMSVNGEGDIRMRGSTGFLVLVNGKPIQSDAAVILAQLPANSIENIELITAPSAKYDADGKSGIINIITKKGTTEGVSLVLNAQYGLPSVNTFNNTEKPLRHGSDGTVNLITDKWDFSFGGSYQQNDIAGRREGEASTVIGNFLTAFPSVGERSFKRMNHSSRASVTFTPDKSNSINAGVYVGQRIQYRLADIIYINSKKDINSGKTVGGITYFNSNLVKRKGDFALANFDYTRTLNSKSSLILSGLYESATFEGFTKNRNLNVNNHLDTLQYALNTNKSPLKGIRGKLDHMVNFGNGRLETGYQIRYQSQRGIFLYQDAILGSGNFTTVPEFSDEINVINRNHAFYSQYSGKQGKLEYTGGIRYEYATRNFAALKMAEPLNLNLSNFFPSINLLYTPTSGYKIKGGFSKRVQRSTNNELNPYAEREHSETLEQGDPQILPEFVNLTELGMIKSFNSGSVFFTFYNQQIKNVVNRVNSIYADTVLNRIFTNAGRANILGFEAGINIRPTTLWSGYIGTNIFNYRIKGSLFNNNIPIYNSGIAYSLNTNFTYQASQTLSFQFNLNYLSSRPTAQGDDSRFVSPNFSAKKAFLKGRLTTAFLWQNLDLGFLNSNEQRITTTGRNFHTTTNYIQEKDVLMLNVGFNLNQLSKKSKLPSSEFGEKEF